MKKNILILFIGIFLMGLSIPSFGETPKYEALTIKVSAKCKMCKDRIEKAMAYERGVKTFAVNLDDKTLILTYDKSKTNPDKIKQAVAKLGHDADEIPANEKAYAKLPACCKKDGSSGCGH